MMRSTDPLPLEAVIFLPRATRRHARGLQALCVVTSKDHAPPSYLVLDLSSKRIATQPPRDDQTTTEISIHEISTALRDWREHGNESVISNPLNWAGILWSVSKIEAYDRGIYTEPWTIPPNFQAAVLELQRTMKQMKFPPSSYGAELRSLDHATSKAIIKYGLNDSSNDH
jgi:hypothetical protein